VVENSPIWAAVLDFEQSGSVIGVSGKLQPDHQQARILVRMHRAPLGYVNIPAQPHETLTSRARTAAELTFADAFKFHTQCESTIDNLQFPTDWKQSMFCPRNFYVNNSAGITVVVCTRDRTEQLRKSLTALRRVSYEPLEILVVDNAPAGNHTRELVTTLSRDDPRLQYTCESSAGLSNARNHGLMHARFDLIAFTDDDTTVDRDWPTALAAGFASDPNAECVTGLVLPMSFNTNAERYFDSRYAWGEAFEPERYDLDEHRHASRLYPFTAGMFGTGANFAVKRRAVLELGGFDPLLGLGSIGRNCEDLDMFLRVILAGGRICYLPSALVWHQHRSDAEALAEQTYSYGHGLGAYVAKHLLNRDFSLSFLFRGLPEKSINTVGRIQNASQSSQLKARSKLLVLSESAGVMAGALRYYWATRRLPQRGQPEPFRDNSELST
jgi:GT2 family glycosyltransferase